MGKLTKALQGARRSAPSIGFAMRQADRQPNMLIIAALSEPKEDLVRAAVAGGADAVAVVGGIAVGALKSTMQKLARAMEGRPLGLVADEALETTSGEELEAAGVDFITLSTEAPAALVTGEIDKVVSLRHDVDSTDVRALDILNLSVFVASRSDESRTGRLKVGEAARIKLLTSITNKPVLVSVADDGLVQDLAAFSRIGVDGFMLEPAYLTTEPETVRAKVESFKTAIGRLGPRGTMRSRGNETPLLPSVAGAPSSEDEDEPELP